MPRPQVLVCREIFQEAYESIVAEADAEMWTEYLPMSRTVLLEKVKGIDGLLSMVTERVDAELMDSAGVAA